MADDYNLLGLGGLTSLVTNVKISKWGNEVLVQCLYDPRGVHLPYSLIFKDCREIRWNVHDEEEVESELADLIGIHLGEAAHLKPALIHTDIFEISIVYGSFSVLQEKKAIAQSKTT